MASISLPGGFAERHILAAMCTTAEMQPGSGIIIEVVWGDGESYIMHFQGAFDKYSFRCMTAGERSPGLKEDCSLPDKFIYLPAAGSAQVFMAPIGKSLGQLGHSLGMKKHVPYLWGRI